MGLLENNLSLRTSPQTGVAIPRIFKHSGNKTRLFPIQPGGCHTSDIGHWFAATYFSNSPKHAAITNRSIIERPSSTAAFHSKPSRRDTTTVNCTLSTVNSY